MDLLIRNQLNSSICIEYNSSNSSLLRYFITLKRPKLINTNSNLSTRACNQPKRLEPKKIRNKSVANIGLNAPSQTVSSTIRQNRASSSLNVPSAKNACMYILKSFANSEIIVHDLIAHTNTVRTSCS